MTITEDVLQSYMTRYPGARKANREDAGYHLTIQLIRRVLVMVEIAMQDEGIDRDVQQRVMRMALYGSAEDPQAAMDRLERHEQVRQTLATAPPRAFIPEQTDGTGR